MSEELTERPGRVQVLLVEDALDQALFLRAMLDPEIYEVTHAQDGQRAWDAFLDGDFEVVISDLNLPALDGFDLCRRIKAQRIPTPVVAVTGFS